jgi:hypothetical protein
VVGVRADQHDPPWGGERVPQLLDELSAGEIVDEDQLVPVR